MKNALLIKLNEQYLRGSKPANKGTAKELKARFESVVEARTKVERDFNKGMVGVQRQEQQLYQEIAKLYGFKVLYVSAGKEYELTAVGTLLYFSNAHPLRKAAKTERVELPFDVTKLVGAKKVLL